ncbi:MAG: ribosome assembly cofactor RimP [Tannerellaceae bacterium]|jgi:ribosome maturation factor RimP|nr:ribosome assembly cofactor RimP [Tannerellaceae bacterium]
MIDKEKIVRIVTDKLSASAHYIVDVSVEQGNRIVVEIDGDEAVGIDDCADLSRYIEANLDRETEDYELEVGSAGLTSPFKTMRQYVKNIGNAIELTLKSGAKQTGVLKTVDEAGLTLGVEKQIKPEGAKCKIKVEEEESYTFDEIKYAKYILKFK